jgi:hypothetical protein
VGKKSTSGTAAGAGAIYGLGVFGALFYFWQEADRWWEYPFSPFQAIFWPAWMVYDAFQALN